jgi:predicted NACHT family NTPase
LEFYYSLTLGVRRLQSVKAGDGSKTTSRHYESWREGVQRLEHEYEEYSEARVFDAIRQTTHTPRHRFWVILGEPGAGKSTLLREWFKRWNAQLDSAYLGLVAPVLVSLRHLEESYAKQDGPALADHFWTLGVPSKALLDGLAEQVYREHRGQWFFPVWLLDGLDEVTQQLLDERFYQKLASLPGLKIVTCRTAVYASLRQEADRYKEREYEVMGLKPQEQKLFVSQALGGDTAQAEILYRAIQRNTQIRLLASNPLMLSLIIQVSRSISLPASRAGFYQEAVQAMWRQKLGQESKRLSLVLTGKRDSLLIALAAKMGMQPAIPAEPPSPVITGSAELAFRKHRCENTP